MALDLRGIFFNLFKPAAPTGFINLPIQSDGGAPYECISVAAPLATTTTAGLAKPDGTSITVATDGTIAAAVTPSAVQQEAFTYAADTGAANAYAVALTPAPSIVAGSVVSFKAAHANTGASTLAVNGGTATSITKNGTTALASGDIAAGQLITARFDGTQWQILAAGSGSGGITQLTGDVTAGPGSGSQAATLAASGVTAGTYTNPTVTFDAKGRATFAANAGTPVASNFLQVNQASGLSVLSSGAYTPVAGKPLIVGVFLSAGDFPNVTGISDTAGNTWVSLGSYTNFSGIRLWVCYSPSGTSTTVNVALSTASGSVAIVSLIQYSSIYAQDGGIAGGSHNIAASQVITGSIATSNANDLLVTFGGVLSSNAACTTPSPFTTDGTGYNSSSFTPASCFGSQLVSATGSYAGTVNLNTTENGPSAVIVAFKVAGGGTSGTSVTSFNTRTGAVVPTTGDYTDAQIAFSDITTNNASTSAHGYAPKLPGDATKYLDGTGAFSVPAGGSGGITLTTTGTSGAATLSGGTLNIPVYASSGGSVPAAISSSPDWPPSSPTTYDDEFAAASLDAKWTWVNQGSATAALGNSNVTLFVPAATGDNQRGFFETLPAPTWQFDAKIAMNIVLANFVLGGLTLTDGTKYETFGFGGNSGSGLVVTHQGSATASFGFAAGPAAGIGIQPFIYLRIKNDGTNLYFSYSFVGANGSYKQLYQEAATSFFGSGPTKIGLAAESNNSSNPVYLSCDWIRRTL